MIFPKIIVGWISESLKRLGYKKTVLKDDAKAFKRKTIRPLLLRMRPDIRWRAFSASPERNISS